MCWFSVYIDDRHQCARGVGLVEDRTEVVFGAWTAQRAVLGIVRDIIVAFYELHVAWSNPIIIATWRVLPHLLRGAARTFVLRCDGSCNCFCFTNWKNAFAFKTTFAISHWRVIGGLSTKLKCIIKTCLYFNQISFHHITVLCTGWKMHQLIHFTITFPYSGNAFNSKFIQL